MDEAGTLPKVMGEREPEMTPSAKDRPHEYREAKHCDPARCRPHDADLRHAELSDATLDNAALRGANLSGAEGISKEVLEQQADSLKRATMPNGQKYEDRLKSRGEENNGS